MTLIKQSSLKARLYLEEPLEKGKDLALSQEQCHYLKNVLRAEEGEYISLFNGQQGEWQAQIKLLNKRGIIVQVSQERRSQKEEPDLWLLFAPLKKKPLDFLVEKATELGVSLFQPVLTERTQMQPLRYDKLGITAIEASQQCERLSVPQIKTTEKLRTVLDAWPKERTLFVGAEAGDSTPFSKALQGSKEQEDKAPIAVLIGPEGGFSTAELELLGRYPFVRKVGLGPRILRAETAALAAVAFLMLQEKNAQEKPCWRDE